MMPQERYFSPVPPARRPRRRSRVPAGRVERFARLGLLAAELAAGGLAEGARRAFGASSAAAATASALLSPGNAERLARRLSPMRGAAMKLGQLLSLEGAVVLPPEFADALAALRASADTMPTSQLRRVLGREYGKGWESRFR
jgi:predicted unusual protein kinase regulating ubiquinone biosynthesis (AarF/ABC1/UbiB family)